MAEEHRDDVELELVEDAGGKCEPRDCGAVDQRVPLARGLLAGAEPARGVVSTYLISLMRSVNFQPSGVRW